MEREPDSLLRNSHATLRVLETHATESVHRHGTTFPGLQSLSHYDCGFPLTGQLMRICPNLRYLHINQSSGQKWPEVEKYHQSHRNSLGGEACVWTSLYKYTGSLNALYMLGLTCHISIVDIHDEKNPFTAPALRELLQDTTPSHLILRTSWTGASYYLNNGFVALMSQPGLWRMANEDIGARDHVQASGQGREPRRDVGESIRLTESPPVLTCISHRLTG